VKRFSPPMSVRSFLVVSCLALRFVSPLVFAVYRFRLRGLKQDELSLYFTKIFLGNSKKLSFPSVCIIKLLGVSGGFCARWGTVGFEVSLPILRKMFPVFYIHSRKFT